MSLLSWNCRGTGGSLCSPKMLHLSRLIASTKAQVNFISETRNKKTTKTNLVNKFALHDAHIVPTEGLAGGLWLLWKQDVSLHVEKSVLMLS